MAHLHLRSRLYFITDQASSRGRSDLELVGLALEGGAGLVQYREKAKTTQEMIEEATQLLALTRRASVPLVINDRLDVALAAGADGVHVGAEDMPVAIARRLLGPDAIVGATVDGPGQARAAQRDGAEYVAIGPIFPSPTKPGCAALGIQAIAGIAAEIGRAHV